MATAVIPEGFRIKIPPGFRIKEPRAARQALPRGRTPEEIGGFNIDEAILGAGEVLEDVGQFTTDVVKAADDPDVFQSAGATFGSALGIPAGPVGVGFGGVLGAAGGQALFDVRQTIGQALGEDVQAPTTEEAFLNPLEAATSEAAFTGALSGVSQLAKGAKPLAKAGILKLAGATSKEASAARDMALRLGVPLNALQTTTRESARGFSKVVSVFPFVGTPVRKGQERAGVQLTKVYNDLLNDIAPTSSAGEVSSEIVRSAKSGFREFRDQAAINYKNVEDLINDLPENVPRDIFPSSPIRQTAGELVAEQQKGAIQGVKRLTDNPLDTYINSLQNIPETLTFDQVRGITKDLNEVMKKAAADGFDVNRGVSIKKAAEESFGNPLIEAGPIKDTLDTANKFFSENMKKFSSATAKKIGTVDRNIFKPKFEQAGSKEADQLFKAAFNTKSLATLRNLNDLVGKKTFNKGTRVHLGDVFESSLKGDPGNQIFDAEEIVQRLGWDTVDGKKATVFMLREAGIPPRMFNDLLETMRAVGRVEIPDVSRFVARRAVLGGAGALTGLGGLGTIKTVILGTGVRSINKVLADPRDIKALTTALDNSVQDKAKNAAFLRILRLAEEEEAE